MKSTPFLISFYLIIITVLLFLRLHTPTDNFPRIYFYIAPIVPLEMLVRSIIHVKTRADKAYKFLAIHIAGNVLIGAIVVDALAFHFY